MSALSANAYVPTALPYADIEREMRDSHLEKFKKITERHDISEEHSHLMMGMTHQELPKLAEKLDAKLIVMGAVSRNKLKRLFIGSTAERTLGVLPCDLLVVKLNPFVTPVELDISDAT